MLDGVIAITHIETNGPLEGSPLDNITESIDLSAVLGAVFCKFHSTPISNNTLSEVFDTAKTMVKDCLDSTLPVQQIPVRVLSAWLPAAIAPNSGISSRAIKHHMKTWLNYVILHVSPEHQSYLVINECLRQNGIADAKTLTWEMRQVYPIGYW